MGKINMKLLVWVPFLLANVLSFFQFEITNRLHLFSIFRGPLDGPTCLMAFCAVLSIIAAIPIFKIYGWHKWTTCLVLAWLLVGQKNLLMGGLLILGWSIGGFAP